MNNSLYGLIHDYYPREKVISIKTDDKLSFFYFPSRLYKVFSKSMTYKSVYIFFDYSDNIKVLRGVEANEIVQIEKITAQTPKGLKTLYSYEENLNDIKELVNSLEYKMFLDFEFTMPGFTYDKRFVSELLQIGAVISDKEGHTVNEYSTYIKTKRDVTDRTKRFLRIKDEDLLESIPQKQFYNEYKRLIDIYNPTIIVWGGNDTKELDLFYSINKLKPIKANYIDLVKLIRRHYLLSEDIGLFNALKIFCGIDASQAHHALTDAAATKEVFDSFKKYINSDNDINLKEILRQMKESKNIQEENDEKETEN